MLVAPRAETAFLPQQAYIPLGDTLVSAAQQPALPRRRGGRSCCLTVRCCRQREQLLFPEPAQPSAQAGASATDTLVAALESVGLGAVLERVGGLDTTRDWAAELSPGEQQRLSMARLLAGRPSLAFLDEATSALDLSLE